ncbi:MAG TPA: 50S ribosomal protein L18e [Candidatus Nanoarchaeia archaeon]|nr:50S ribosomal protein L18e [Candidatus Nanoarchaeia archaeon]
MKSKTQIEKQMQKKNNSELVETLMNAKKKDKWIEIAGIISGPRRKRINLNLDEINNQAKEKEKIIVPGKVLSQGEINKKIKVIALGFSEKAKEKLKKSGCEFSNILTEIKSNPSAEGIRILK